MPSPQYQSDSQTQALVQQIAGLERRNRRTQILVIVALAGLMLPWAMGAARDNKDQTLQARRIVLFDQDGKLRVFIGADKERDGRVGLYLYDQLGQRSAAVYVKPGHGGFSLYGPNNRERASLSLNPYHVGLSLYDSEKQEKLRLALEGDRSSLGLGPSDEFGRHLAGLSANGNNSSLYMDTRQDGSSLISLGDQNSGSHVRLQTSKIGSHLLLRSHDGLSRVQIEPANDRPAIKMDATTHSPSLVIFDAQGQLISHLP